MKIKCINNTQVESQLKLNQEYEPIVATENYYVIQLKKGTKGTYKKDRFEEIKNNSNS